MKNELKCGVVSIVGRPNTGKSTLLNRIIGEKVAIVTKTPQTTRNQIRGIYTDERGQVIFIDTPGLHKAKDRLDKFMNNVSLSTAQETDCILHIVDSNKPVGPEEKMVVERLLGASSPTVLVLNKVDQKGKCADEYIELWRKFKGDKINDTKSFTIVPVSSKTGKNIDLLMDIVFNYLPKGKTLYDTDTISDTPRKIVIADIIREKFLNILRQEIPHSLAVVVEEITPRRKKVTHITASILLERESHKEIVIGKKGSVLKKAGTLARKELEELIERKVYLELDVKLKKRWRDNDTLLKELGYSF